MENTLKFTAEELLKNIKNNLTATSINDSLVTPTMYHPDRFEKEVSFAILDKVEKGYYKRFIVTVKEQELKDEQND